MTRRRKRARHRRTIDYLDFDGEQDQVSTRKKMAFSQIIFCFFIGLLAEYIPWMYDEEPRLMITHEHAWGPTLARCALIITPFPYSAVS